MGVFMLPRKVVLGFAAVIALSGCSILADKKQVDYKAGATQVQPLEVPPDLTVPESEQRYTIPGTDGAKVASYSEYTKQVTEQPCVAPASGSVVSNPAPVAAVATKLEEINGVKTILIAEPFDRSWRKVGLAMDKSGIAAADKDRANGIYFISAPGKSKKKLKDYQVTVHETAAGCEVAVNDGDGESNAETVRITETLYKNFEK